MLVTQLVASVPEPGSKHEWRPSHDRWYRQVRREPHLLPAWLPFPSQVFPVISLASCDTLVV